MVVNSGGLSAWATGNQVFNLAIPLPSSLYRFQSLCLVSDHSIVPVIRAGSLDRVLHPQVQLANVFLMVGTWAVLLRSGLCWLL